jgi:hypothetical protein
MRSLEYTPDSALRAIVRSIWNSRYARVKIRLRINTAGRQQFEEINARLAAFICTTGCLCGLAVTFDTLAGRPNNENVIDAVN